MGRSYGDSCSFVVLAYRKHCWLLVGCPGYCARTGPPGYHKPIGRRAVATDVANVVRRREFGDEL